MDRRDIDICPSGKRGLRACLLCSLIKTFDQFVQDGCENCETILQMGGSDDRVLNCTSPTFTGVVSKMDGDGKSWVSRWQRIDKFRPGCYALSVTGVLPEDYVRSFPENVHYHSRDTSEEV